MTDFDGVGKFQLYAADNSFTDDVAVTFDVDGVTQRVFVTVVRATDTNAFGNIGGVGIGFLIDFVQLRAVNMRACRSPARGGRRSGSAG